MATVVNGNQIKLADGSIVAAQEGGWYDGAQLWGGQLGAPGVIINPNQQGYGQPVSSEVNRQSDAAQGLAPGTIDAYLASLRQTITGDLSAGANGASALGASLSGMGAGKPGSLDVNALYEQNFNTPGMQELKGQYDTKRGEIDKLYADMAQAEANINDNPFYSEASRVGKIAKLRDQFNNDLTARTRELTTIQEKMAMDYADAQIKMNLALKQYDINRQEYKDTLDQFNFLLQSGALLNATGSDIANLAVATGISTSMIQSIIDKQRKDQISPQVITSTDNWGNVTYAVIDQNTGALISKNSLGNIGKSDKGSAGDTKSEGIQVVGSFFTSNRNDWGHVSPTVWNQGLEAWLNNNFGTSEDFIRNYAMFTDPNRDDFARAYGFDKGKRDALIGGNTQYGF